MPDVRPDWKPVTEGGIGRPKPDRGNRRRGRRMATRDQWAVLRAEKLEAQSCRLMVRLDGWNRLCCNTLELHHIIPRSQGGDDVADNLLPLCSWHHGMVTLRDEGYLQNLAAALTDAEYAYVIGKLGEGALERLFGVSR